MMRLRCGASPRHLLVLACLTATIGFALIATGSAAGRGCGLTARIHGVRYDMREVRGSASCPTIKHVVTTFLQRGAVAPPWTCALGHGSSPFAASCARGARVLVRVYAPT